MAACDRFAVLLFIVAGLLGIWLFLFMSLFHEDSSPTKILPPSTTSVRINNPSRHSGVDLSPIQIEVNQPKIVKHEEMISSRELNNEEVALIDSKIGIPMRYEEKFESVEPPSLEEISRNMTLYLSTLHKKLSDLAGPTVDALTVWETFLDVTKTMPMAWDDQNRYRFPHPRKDGTIFVSLGTYRDPYCPMTIKSLYANAKNPDKLFVGVFQQNCFGPKCRTGVLVGGRVEDAGPDPDCYKEFCSSQEGINSNACNNGHVSLFNVNESESLGPYMARYLGAKFYRGEQYYLQIDSHSEFVKNWDEKLIKMVNDAEAEKPVISTYPPDSTQNWRDTIGFRMCDSEFAASQIEWQIIRLGSSLAFDHSIPDKPRYAPFVAAGFFFAPADFLYEVPFDPLLPWIFMGEEISMSVRLWTSGYDIFSPTVNVLDHYYVRRHYPKFWESVNRFFKKPIHNDIVEIVLNRVKCMLGYPESRPEVISPQTVLYRQSDWSMGKKRSAKKYFEMVGLDMNSKRQTPNKWCHKGEWPEIAKEYQIVKN